MSMNETQKKKAKFRSSKSWKLFRHKISVWKLFRHKISVKQKGLDYITHAKLRKMSNLHHMDLNEKNYTNLDNEDNFIFCNHNTHCWIHEIYTYYKKDPEVLERLKEVLDRMVEINA